MLLIGLTGSIATGKSTVSALLSQAPYSLTIIDADVLARQVVAPGTPGYRSIVSHFGPTTPDLLQPPSPSLPDDGHDGEGRPLDRAALGRRVFGSSEAKRRDRAVLNAVVHPAVRKAMFAQVLWAYLRRDRAVVLDVPLLFESALDVFCGTVLVVGVRDPEVQLQRLLARDRAQGGTLTELEARERLASQGDVRGKVARVGVRGRGWGETVWNDGGREDLRREVHRVMGQVEAASPRWWSLLCWACPPLALVMALRAWMWGREARRRFEEMERREKAKL